MATQKQTTTTSGWLNLDSKDFVKGLVLAVVAPVLTLIIQTLQAGSLKFDWKALGITAVSAFAAYLLKNLFSPQQIVIENPTKTDVEAVKAGAQAKVVK